MKSEYSQSQPSQHAASFNCQTSVENSHPMSYQFNADQANIDSKDLKLFEEQNFSQMIEYLDTKIYRRMIEKIFDGQHIVRSLKIQKVILSEKQFHSDRYVDEIKQYIQFWADGFDSWFKFNISQKQELLALKKRIIDKNKKKADVFAEISRLIQEIAEKYRQNKIKEIIQKIKSIRKANQVNLIPNPNIAAEKQKIKRKLQEKNNGSDIQFQKASQRIADFKLSLQKSTGLQFSNLKSYLI